MRSIHFVAMATLHASTCKLASQLEASTTVFKIARTDVQT